MVLKKPYAFLIKYFRLIHLIIAIPLVYLAIKSFSIVTFFNDYVLNNYSLTVSGDLSGMFISSLMYLSIVIIILSAIAIYFLFKYKEKPAKNYIAIIVYYLILFVLIGVTANILDVLETNVIEASLARTYRDSSLLIALPQIYFCIFVILRALGFNIKKLNFASDLKELEISEKDSEEFEFIVGVEGYKAKRTFRRFIREFSYYVRENTFIFIAIILLLLIGISTTIFVNKENYEVAFNIGESFVYKSFTISIEDSIKTNMSYNGSIINKDKNYLITKLKIKNNSTEPTKLDYTSFGIKLNNQFIYPIIDKASYFADYAIPYDGKEIAASKENIYVLVYEIPNDDKKDEYELKIYNGLSQKNGEIHSRYINVTLKPLLIDTKTEVNTVGLNEKLDLTNSNIGDTTLTINKYELTNKYIYTYEKCNNTCRTYTDYVTLDYYTSGVGSTLLALDYDLELAQNSAYSIYTKSEKNFFNNFLTIRYKFADNVYTSSVKNLTPNNLNNVLVLQVSENIENAEYIEVLITIRNKVYSIKLTK